MTAEAFFDRVSYSGTPDQLATQICDDYQLGELQAYRVPPMGYEDLNLALETTEGTFFAKVFASSRDQAGIRRYVTTMETALAAGISHPQLYEAPEGEHIHQLQPETAMTLMEYIPGGTILEQGRGLGKKEGRKVIHQAALINKLDYHPEHEDDSWAEKV